MPCVCCRLGPCFLSCKFLGVNVDFNFYLGGHRRKLLMDMRLTALTCKKQLIVDGCMIENCTLANNFECSFLL